MSKKTKQGIQDLNALFGKQPNAKREFSVAHKCWESVEHIDLGRGFWVERCTVCKSTLQSGSDLY